METFFRKSVLAGIGLINMTAEKIEELVDEAIKRGEVSPDERSRYVKDTMEKVEQRASEAKKWISEQVEEAMNAFKPKTEKQYETLNERIDRLTEELNKLKEELSKQKNK